MSYFRVLPRDLFNESKLLKCLGRVTLLIHDGFGGDLEFDFEDPEQGFLIDTTEDGDFFCRNLSFYVNSESVFLYSGLNSKENYPLFFDYELTEYTKTTSFCREYVFDPEGEFTELFKEIIRAK